MKYDIHKVNNLELPKVLKNYIVYMNTIQNKSENTIDGYRIDITMFLRYLKLFRYLVPLDTDFETINIKDITDEFMTTITLPELHSFIKFTDEYKNNCSATRARKVAVLKSFFKYMHDKIKLIKENPALELESPRQSKKLPVYLSLEESESLLNSVNGRNKERDYCMITLFLNCGLRLSELCNIKIQDIRDDILIVTGKGDKERSIYLNEVCMRSIERYLNKRKFVNSVNSIEYLFLSEQKNSINKRTVQRTVKKYIIESGLDPLKYSTHKLRHTAATLLYKYGNVDINKLQKILGHENISTTMIYTHVDDEQLKIALSSNPLNKINVNSAIY